MKNHMDTAIVIVSVVTRVNKLIKPSAKVMINAAVEVMYIEIAR